MTVQANQYKIETFIGLEYNPTRGGFLRLTRGYVSKEGIFLGSGTLFKILERSDSYVLIEVKV